MKLGPKAGAVSPTTVFHAFSRLGSRLLTIDLRRIERLMNDNAATGLLTRQRS